MRLPQHWHPSLLSLLSLLTAALGACVQHADGPGVFGGKGAKVTSLDEKPLPAGAGEPNALGPCGKNGPPSDTQVIDDFEDGNDRIFKGFERDGFWFAASDKTEGSTVTPNAPFAAELLPTAESSKDNRYAAHLTAAGEKNWGVVWGAALQWTREGIKCPLNVSSFAGVRFRAKGPGTIRLSIAVPEVTPKEGGGTCVDRCYDAHGKVFLLSEAWDNYEMRWEKMQQGGWGAEARFTPERIVNIAVNADVKSLPIDLWLDDVELIPKTPASAAPTPTAAPRP
jgi:Carbohydrate binding domain (family 11)